MATTGIWKIEKRLDNVLDYTTNVEKTKHNENNNYYDLHNVIEYVESDYKTEEQLFVSGINCSHKTALEEMSITKEQYGKTDGILGFHAFQSFAEGEVTPEQCHASWFIDGRISKYHSSVGVWNLKQDYKLNDYINFYSGGTVRYFNQHDDKKETEVLSYSQTNEILNRVIEKDYLVWQMEQTKEARFLPSLVQNKVQIGIIFNSDNKYTQKLLKGDILNYINHTMKIQIIKGTDTGFIYEIQIGLGAEHDFHLFKRTFEGTPENVTYTADLGYVGINKIHNNSKIPKKKSKNHPLTEDDINYNKDIGSARIFIEHTNGWIKRFKILSTKFRNNLNFFAPFAVLICALYSFYIA